MENNLEPRLSKLETSVEGINSRIDRFGVDVQKQFDSFARTLDTIGNRFAEAQRDQTRAGKPQYVGFATVGIACLAIFASFAALLATPMDRRIADVEANNRRLSEHYVSQLIAAQDEAKELGKVMAQLDSLQKCADTVTKSTVINDGRIARIEGKEPLMESWLRAVDHRGSRKWVTSRGSDE